MHEKYMKIKENQHYSEIPREEAIKQLKQWNEYNQDDGLTKMTKQRMSEWARPQLQMPNHLTAW